MYNPLKNYNNMLPLKNTRSLVIIISILSIINGLQGQNKNDSLYTATETTLQTTTGSLYGTLTIPKEQSTMPVVLIIAGSGPTDRDGNSILGVKTDTYKQLAEALANNGIASLRYDKRGIAASKDAMESEEDLVFETYINDAKAWISLLKADKRFSKIIVLGHSEGSLIGMVAAQESGVDQYISIAGIGRRIDFVLKEQLKGKLPTYLEEESNKILENLTNGYEVSEVSKDLYALYRPSVQPYMISWLKFNPVVEIQKLNIPILIIQGTTDIQVTVNDAQLLAAGKPESTLVIIKNMNHVLKKSSVELKENKATYNKPELPLIKGLVKKIVTFIYPH